MTESLALAAVETLTTLPSYQALETYVYVRVDLPSVVIPHSWKILLNPRHPAMDDLQIREAEVFPVDERLRGA